MRRRKRFLRRKKGKEEMDLQITSMADIMIILLIFLLKSMAAGTSTVSPPAGLMLPEASAHAAPIEEMTKIEISQGAVLIDGEPVTNLREFEFSPGDLEQDGTPRSLNAVLVRKHEAESKRAPAEAGGEIRMLVLADQRTPYSTLKTILTAATQHGFAGFKLVMVGSQ
jgi:biopolymer transport protein ExbD